MAFDASLPQDVVTEHVDRAIENHDVVVFAKGTRSEPQCQYSKRALGLINEHRDEYATVDVLESLEEFRTALERHSGWETIPQVYVDGEFVGGSDVLAELAERGELGPTLASGE